MKVLKQEDLSKEANFETVFSYEAKEGEKFGDQLFLIDKENEGHLYELEISQEGMDVYLSDTTENEIWIYAPIQ